MQWRGCFSTLWIKKQHNKSTKGWLIITNLSSKGLPPRCPLVILCLLSPFLHHSPTSPRTSHLNSHLPTTSPHLSSSLTHFELLSHFSSFPLKAPLPPPSLASFTSSPLLYLPIASLASLVNNSTAVHTWVVIVELHIGDLEDKWTIRMEELKTSPRLHYRARGICRLPG